MRLFLSAFFVLLLFSAAPASRAVDASLSITWTKALSEPVASVDWSPDGTSIILGDADHHQITLLNWQTREIIWQVPFPEAKFPYSPYAYSIRWSRDGNWIAVTASGGVYLVDPQRGEFHALTPTVAAERDQPDYLLPRWGNDSNALAVLDTNGYIDIFDTTTDNIIQTIALIPAANYVDPNLTAFDWSPDGQRFVASYLSGSMVGQSTGFWDRAGNLLTAYTQESVTDPAPQIPCPHPAGDSMAEDLTYFEWANDSRTLVVALYAGLAVCRLHDDGTIELHALESYGTIFGWSPDQHWLAGAINTDTMIWIADAANDYQVVSSRPPGGSAAASLAWSPDSQHLAMGTRNELWIGTLQMP